MEKIIYLQNENYDWIEFKYNNISELSEHFKSCEITVGEGVIAGNNSRIGGRASIGGRQHR